MTLSLWDCFAVAGLLIFVFLILTIAFEFTRWLIWKIPYIKKRCCDHEYYANDIYYCDLFFSDRMAFRCKRCGLEITVPLHEIRTLIGEYDEN